MGWVKGRFRCSKLCLRDRALSWEETVLGDIDSSISRVSRTLVGVCSGNELMGNTGLSGSAKGFTDSWSWTHGKEL